MGDCMWIISHAPTSATVAATVVLLVCNQTQGLARGSQVGHDDPWDVERINRLPDEVRTAVIRMCRTTPRAGHYFATYIDNSRVMKLHFEHLHCGGQTPFCKDRTCLRQEYVSTGGHYQLKKSYYGGNDD